MIWLDDNVNDKGFQDAKQKLDSITSHLEKFQDVTQCQKYIEEQSQYDRLVIIVNGRLGEVIVPSIHGLQQIKSIYVYCMDIKRNKQWTCKYEKVKAVIVEIDELISLIMTDHNILQAEDGPLSTTSATARAGAGKLDNFTDEDVLKLAKNEIIRVLKLEAYEIKDTIVNDLLENGRQSLSKYEEDLLPDIYAAAINEKDGDLMKSLKKYLEQKWIVKYGSSNQWFIKFLKEYKDSVNYNSILNRTAEYGNKYLKDCPILSIVLQLLFEGIDVKCPNERNVFNDLWCAITNDGLKCIEDFSNYMNENVMLELKNTKESVLIQALREYYRPKLFELFKRIQILDHDNLYDLALNNVAEYGWLQGLQAVKQKIIPKYFKELLANISQGKLDLVECLVYLSF
ncbi:unnamed protein product [Rotaria sp. Silwood1]|nr:unnamed protein product [Rotaria sp. Silwood1]CAF1604712.1 unnamed protein product [Rotaria sp. Silwood1]CAF5093649.1 unnamed protein product [Rotaria sp. Silwood1]